MRALVKTATGHGNLELRDVPVPQVDAGEVLIRVRACGICGSDLKIQGDQHPYTPPVVIGQEFAGEIVEVGAEVSGWVVGDRVVSEQHPVDEIKIPYRQAMFRALTVSFSYNSKFTSWERALSLFERGAIKPSQFMTHVLPLEEWSRGFDLSCSGEAVKVVLEPYSLVE